MSAFTRQVKSCCATVMISNPHAFCLPVTCRMTCPHVWTPRPAAPTTVSPLASLNGQMGENVRFSLVAEASDVADCDTLIYYWPKNKPEAQFQLMNLLSLLPVGIDVSSSVKTAPAFVAPNRCWPNMSPDESGQRTSLRAVSRASGKQPTFDPHSSTGANTLWKI